MANYYGYSGPLKRKSDFSLEEWEKYQVISMDLVKDNSEYVGVIRRWLYKLCLKVINLDYRDLKRWERLSEM